MPRLGDLGHPNFVTIYTADDDHKLHLIPWYRFEAPRDEDPYLRDEDDENACFVPFRRVSLTKITDFPLRMLCRASSSGANVRTKTYVANPNSRHGRPVQLFRALLLSSTGTGR